MRNLWCHLDERKTMTGKMRVVCNSAPLGYERYEGQYGDLRYGPLPLLLCYFFPLEGGEVPIGSKIEQWSFTQDKDAIWYCTKALRKEYVGRRFVTRGTNWVCDAGTPKEYSVATGGEGWEFSTTWPPENATKPSAVEQPKHRERDKYDEKQFERDLDEAIEEAQSMCESLIEPALSFKRGDGWEVAVNKVFGILVWRSISDDVRSACAPGVWSTTKKMLLEKNRAYGDSALNPVRIFATASPMEQLLVRLDDKVSRLERGQAAGEDVANDLLGYLILVLIAKIRERRQ